MNAKPKSILFLSALALAVLLNAVIWAGHYGYRLNTTNSVPIGLYKLTLDPTAPYVSFCPTEKQAFIANDRDYRPRSLACPDGFAPLLKPIAAHGGDVVTISARGISVNGTLLPNSIARHADGKGRPLPVLPFGVYPVQPGTIWGISTYNPASFDSRYFGPISLRRITSYAQPVLTF